MDIGYGYTSIMPVDPNRPSTLVCILRKLHHSFTWWVVQYENWKEVAGNGSNCSTQTDYFTLMSFSSPFPDASYIVSLGERARHLGHLWNPRSSCALIRLDLLLTYRMQRPTLFRDHLFSNHPLERRLLLQHQHCNLIEYWTKSFIKQNILFSMVTLKSWQPCVILIII